MLLMTPKTKMKVKPFSNKKDGIIENTSIGFNWPLSVYAMIDHLEEVEKAS